MTRVPRAKERRRLEALRRLRDRWQKHAEEAVRNNQNAGFVQAEASALSWAVEMLEKMIADRDRHHTDGSRRA